MLAPRPPRWAGAAPSLLDEAARHDTQRLPPRLPPQAWLPVTPQSHREGQPSRSDGLIEHELRWFHRSQTAPQPASTVASWAPGQVGPDGQRRQALCAAYPPILHTWHPTGLSLV